MKKTKIIALLLWIVPIFIIGLILYYPIKVNLIENQVTNYLEENKGYDSSEIHSVEGQLSKLPSFSVNVIFEDETHLIYRYKVEDGEVLQMVASLSEEGGQNNTVKQKYHDHELDLKHEEGIQQEG